jgi:hypothetical protein
LDWAVISATGILTVLRLFWIGTRSIPRDIDPAIMPGLKNIGKVLRGEVIVGGRAPYGIIWYAINLPIALAVNYDGRYWMLSLGIFDGVFLWLSWVSMGPLGGLAYVLIGTFQLLRAPWNTSINWLIMLGLFSPWFLLVAPLAKLPFGLPRHSFGDTGRAFFFGHNWVYYGLLGTLWLIVAGNLYLPASLVVETVSFGTAWSVVLGYLYLRKHLGVSRPPTKK